jgi:aarF domain-containing kinase
MIKQELGGPMEEIFESFEQSPIGAASLAQVHRAVTKQGKVVAVKLQYPGLSDQLASDFFVFKQMSAMLQNWAMGLDLNVLLQDFEATVRRELNFLDEAQNTETTRQALRHLHPAVLVPATVPELCSRRILTMEYVDGMVKLQPPRLQQIQLPPKQVIELVCDTFAHMACCHGRVHGDPHAGNVYARQLPGAKRGTPQLVMLDHGLVHLLDEDMRVDFCNMFLSCVNRSGAEMSRLGQKFAGPLGRFFPLVLSPWFIFGSSVTFADIRAAYRRQLPPGVSLKDVGETLVKMYGNAGLAIGLLHSLGYTRGLLNDLGCSERQRVASLARYARLGLEDEKYRTGAADARGAPPDLGAPLKPCLVLAPRFPTRLSMMLAAFQVRITSIMLSFLWPVACWMETRTGSKRKKEEEESEESKKQRAAKLD